MAAGSRLFDLRHGISDVIPRFGQNDLYTQHLTDEWWERINPLLPPCKGSPGGALFNALLWMARTGAAWLDLPERLGKWNVVYQRYAHWCDKGHFERLFQAVQQPDMDELMVDSTCCKAHQASAGARKTSGPQAIGIKRGGLNTKIHALCDALGNPLSFLLTLGQRHDSKAVPELLDGFKAKAEWHLLKLFVMTMKMDFLASLSARNLQQGVGFGSSLSHSGLDAPGPFTDSALGDQYKKPSVILSDWQTARHPFCP